MSPPAAASPAEAAGRDVDQHQVQRPAAQPVLGLCASQEGSASSFPSRARTRCRSSDRCRRESRSCPASCPSDGQPCRRCGRSAGRTTRSRPGPSSGSARSGRRSGRTARSLFRPSRPSLGYGYLSRVARCLSTPVNGVALLLWRRHPEPTGSGEQRRQKVSTGAGTSPPSPPLSDDPTLRMAALPS